MKVKQLPCEVCGAMCNIRSKVKSGPNEGKKCCPKCANYKLGTSSKTKEKRKVERANLPSFFISAVDYVKEQPVCQNCGAPIRSWLNPHWNVAHILKKSIYKSVADNLDNFVILCAHKDEANNCHEKFDGALSNRVKMPVFKIALQNFVKFKDLCLERGKEFYIFEENL